MQGAFNYEGKCDFDFNLLEVKSFVTQRVESRTRVDYLFDEETRKVDIKPFVLELSLTDDDTCMDDIEESKLAGSELSKASRVALLRVFMLHK